MLEAMGGELANVFNRVDGVLMAEAIVSLPEFTDLTQPDQKPCPRPASSSSTARAWTASRRSARTR